MEKTPLQLQPLENHPPQQILAQGASHYTTAPSILDGSVSIAHLAI